MNLTHLPDGTVQLEIAPAEVATLGADASLLLDWVASALSGLVSLREGRQLTANDWHYLITHLEHRLAPRLDGLRDAVIRAHHASGGSLADLALAMDVERSTAQYRRDRVIKRDPSVWETWALAGGPRRPIADN